VSTDLAREIARIRGANYIPSNAANATQMWLDLDVVGRLDAIEVSLESAAKAGRIRLS
jgi:hypothetical protein